MKLYIWEGGRISTGYHDDGTLVVLAESPEQARRLAIESAIRWEKLGGDRWDSETYQVWVDGLHSLIRGIYWMDENPSGPDWQNIPPDAINRAIDREPDRIVELDAPTVVSFNGGGYD